MNASPGHEFRPWMDDDLPLAVRAEGAHIIDAEGKRYIDAAGSMSVVTIGHGVPEIVEAIAEQAGRLTYTHQAYLRNEPAEKLAQLLCELAPPGLPYVLYSPGTGSAAVEAAIKLARYYWWVRGEKQKYKVVSLGGSYHGMTLGALAISSMGEAFTKPMQPLFGDFSRKIGGYTCRLCDYGKTYPSCELYCASALERLVEKEGAETISAFIAEPMTLPLKPAPDYWAKIRELCDRHGILLIMDEVKMAFGHTGPIFATQHWDVPVDLLVFGKATASGYASVFGSLVSREVFDTIKTKSGFFPHGHTLQGHALASATALAVQRYAIDRGLYGRTEILGARLEAAILDAAGELAENTEIVRAGMYLAVLKTGTVEGRETLSPRARKKLIEIGMTGSVSPTGFGYAIAMMPPYMLTDDDVAEIASKTRTLLETL